MKKILILACLVCALVLFTSCPKYSLPENTISFTVNGTLVELTKGFASDGGIPVICRITEDLTWLVIFGSDEETSGEQPNEYICIMIQGDSAGSFSNATLYYYNLSSSISVVGTASGSIDALNAVGEYCTGTFSGTGIDVQTDDVYTFADGEFNIIRSADNSLDL